MTRLHSYLTRLYDTISSRREIEIKSLEVLDRSDMSGQSSELYAVLIFPDSSELHLVEQLVVQHYALVKSRYSYHYQQASGELIFRYDNAPHHPDLLNYPHHKHIGEQIVSAQAPDLSDVLKEIDAILYA
jgi:hypothetical protein